MNKYDRLFDLTKDCFGRISELEKFNRNLVSAVEAIGWGITLEDAAKRGYDSDSLRFIAHLSKIGRDDWDKK